MNVPKVGTPVGAAALSSAVVTILMYLLSFWHFWSQVPTGVKGAVATILTAVVVYLAGYFKIRSAPGQTMQVTSNTPGPLPTLAATSVTVPPPAAVPEAKV